MFLLRHFDRFVVELVDRRRIRKIDAKQTFWNEFFLSKRNETKFTHQRREIRLHFRDRVREKTSLLVGQTSPFSIDKVWLDYIAEVQLNISMIQQVSIWKLFDEIQFEWFDGDFRSLLEQKRSNFYNIVGLDLLDTIVIPKRTFSFLFKLEFRRFLTVTWSIKTCKCWSVSLIRPCNESFRINGKSFWEQKKIRWKEKKFRFLLYFLLLSDESLFLEKISIFLVRQHHELKKTKKIRDKINTSTNVHLENRRFCRENEL